MKITHKHKKIALMVAVGLIIFLMGWWGAKLTMQSHSGASADKKPLYWVAPMDPNYRRDKPGKSPMGMDLVPVYEEGAADEGGIKISPTVENNIGVRVAPVAEHLFDYGIRTVAYIQANENATQTVSMLSQGWVRDLQVKSIGEKIHKGEVLFKLYSPELVSAQEEYLLALEHNNDLLIKSGKQKLKTLGMSLTEIGEISSKKKVIQNISVYAKQDGFVTDLSIKDGSHVMPAKHLITITNLDTIWAIMDVYPHQAKSLRLGQNISFSMSTLGSKTISGKIDYIYPELNTKRRTVRVRSVLPNPGIKLKPDMYGTAVISGHAMKHLAVPKEAVIHLGNENRVVLAFGDGRFKPVNVTLGMQDSNWVEIKKGVTRGEKVVTSAHFLLDSESSLRAGLARVSSEHNHGEEKIEIKPANNTNEKSDNPMNHHMHHAM